MSYQHPSYDPVGPGGGYSPHDHTTYISPVSYHEPFQSPDVGYFGPSQYGDHGDLGGGIELEQRRTVDPRTRNIRTASIATTPIPQFPAQNEHRDRMYSTSSTVFPNNDDRQSFLHNSRNHANTFLMSNSYGGYKDNTGRQLRHIFFTSTSRFFITAALCGGYIYATREWQQKGAVSENAKRVFNTITTSISIALGLNIASSFKDMALNMRWPILHAKKRSLVEVDLLLSADSLSKLVKLAFVTKRPLVIIGCILWLLINILAQAGIAMLSLTYGFEPSYFDLQFTPNSNVSIPNLDHFYPVYSNMSAAPSLQDQEYTAHGYGQAVYNYGINDTKYLPVAGAIYQPRAAMLYWSNATDGVDFVFSDSPTDMYLGTYSVYTARRVNVTFSCESHKVTKNGDGTNNTIVVDKIGTVSLSQTVPESTTYFTNKNHVCESNNRCSVVEAFESFAADPWYYRCNVTMGYTYNDPKNVSFLSDEMAQIATGSIAQVGYTDSKGQAAQTYPRESSWGASNAGSERAMGYMISLFALGTIAGTAMSGPLTSYIGDAPSGGVYLHVGHQYSFYTILGMICGCHLLFCIIVAVLANRVMVGPDGHISMSLLLKPIADALEGVSGGVENKVFRDAKRKTKVIYSKGNRGKWALNIVET